MNELDSFVAVETVTVLTKVFTSQRQDSQTISHTHIHHNWTALSNLTALIFIETTLINFTTIQNHHNNSQQYQQIVILTVAAFSVNMAHHNPFEANEARKIMRQFFGDIQTDGVRALYIFIYTASVGQGLCEMNVLCSNFVSSRDFGILETTEAGMTFFSL